MSKKTSPTLREHREPNQTIEQHINGASFVFPKDEPLFSFRPLKAEERAELDFRERVERAKLIAHDDEIKALAKEKASDAEIEQIRKELETMFEQRANDEEEAPYWFNRIEQITEHLGNRTAADDPIERHLSRLRNIMIARMAMCDLEGNPISFDDQNERVQELAIVAANVYEGDIATLPFELVLSSNSNTG